MSFYLDGTYSNTDFVNVNNYLVKISSKVSSIWLQYAVARLLDYQKNNPNMNQWFHVRGVILTRIYNDNGFRSDTAAKFFGDAGSRDFLIVATGLNDNLQIESEEMFNYYYNKLWEICHKTFL